MSEHLLSRKFRVWELTYIYLKLKINFLPYCIFFKSTINIRSVFDTNLNHNFNYNRVLDTYYSLSV